MSIKSLPEAVRSKLEEWFYNPYTLHQVWEQDGTYFLVVETQEKGETPDLYFIRIFQVGSTWHLSQDGVKFGD